jgi:hypothetical protein
VRHAFPRPTCPGWSWCHGDRRTRTCAPPTVRTRGAGGERASRAMPVGSRSGQADPRTRRWCRTACPAVPAREFLARGAVGRAGCVPRRTDPVAHAERGERGQVGHPHHLLAQCGLPRRRPDPRIGEQVVPAFVVHEDARPERAQVQGGHVDVPREFRIGGQEDLKSPVEPHPVHDIGPHAAADVVTGLAEHDVQARLTQQPRGAETGETRSDNHDIRHHPDLTTSPGNGTPRRSRPADGHDPTVTAGLGGRSTSGPGGFGPRPRRGRPR